MTPCQKEWFNVISIEGSLRFDKRLQKNHLEYLKAFAKTKRMIRDISILKEIKDPLRTAVSLPIGKDGEFFVAAGTSSKKSIIDHKKAPGNQPTEWCPFYPSEDGNFLLGEMFEIEFAKDWLAYMVESFFQPWGYSLTGKIRIICDPIEMTRTVLIKNNQVELCNFQAFA